MTKALAASVHRLSTERRHSCCPPMDELRGFMGNVCKIRHKAIYLWPDNREEALEPHGNYFDRPAGKAIYLWPDNREEALEPLGMCSGVVGWPKVFPEALGRAKSVQVRARRKGARHKPAHVRIHGKHPSDELSRGNTQCSCRTVLHSHPMPL